MTMFKWVKVIPVLLFVVACTTSAPDPEAIPKTGNDILEIRYGTSFGLCMGYCIRMLEITAEKIEFTKKGWGGQVPEINCDATSSLADFSHFSATIDLSDFFSLPETLGCPDCADGGAEWLEIRTANKVYKVTFEYLKEPEAITQIVTELRELCDDFENCGN